MHWFSTIFLALAGLAFLGAVHTSVELARMHVLHRHFSDLRWKMLRTFHRDLERLQIEIEEEAARQGGMVSIAHKRTILEMREAYDTRVELVQREEKDEFAVNVYLWYAKRRDKLFR